MSDHNTVGFPLRDGSFGLIAVVQSFVFRAWFRRRQFVGDHLDPYSCDNFRDEMQRWLKSHVDRGGIAAFDLVYDESVWPATEDDHYSNRLLLRVHMYKGDVGHYAFDVRLNRPLLECVSSANPNSDHFSVPYNIFDVTCEVDHEGTPDYVKEVLA